MNRTRFKLKKTICVVMACVLLGLLTACSRLAAMELPPLPTPRQEQPAPTMDAFVQEPVATPEPPAPSAAPTLPPTPEPTPVPTPEPTPEPEDPNIPHLYIENATYPESMGQYGSADLLGEIYTDKGVIAQVCGRIYNNDTGQNEQICLYYPYESYFSLAGTVNAKLIFGMLEPGHYTYIVSAIAENNSYTNGEEVLIEHGFEIYYP